MQLKKIIFALCALFAVSLSAMEENPYYLDFVKLKVHYLSTNSYIELTPKQAEKLNQWLKWFPERLSFDLHKVQERTLKIYRQDLNKFSINYGLTENKEATEGVLINVEVHRTTIHMNYAADKEHIFTDQKKIFFEDMIRAINIYVGREKRREGGQIPSNIPLTETLKFMQNFAELIRNLDESWETTEDKLWIERRDQFIAKFQQLFRYYLSIEDNEMSCIRNGSNILLNSGKAEKLNQWLALFPQNKTYLLHKNEQGKILQVYRNANIFSINYDEGTPGLNIEVKEDQTIIKLNFPAENKNTTTEEKKAFFRKMIACINQYLSVEEKRSEIPPHLQIPLTASFELLHRFKKAYDSHAGNGWADGYTADELWKGMIKDLSGKYPQKL